MQGQGEQQTSLRIYNLPISEFPTRTQVIVGVSGKSDHMCQIKILLINCIQMQTRTFTRATAQVINNGETNIMQRKITGFCLGYGE